jgi:hypothetical protein
MSCRSGDKAIGLSFVLPSGGFAKTVDLKKAMAKGQIATDTPVRKVARCKMREK